MSILNSIGSSFGARMMTGSSGSLFKQVAMSAAQATLGLAVQPSYENQTQIYLTDPQSGERLQLPVLPPEITIKWDRQTETVNVLNLGEVDFTNGKKLQEISFSSFFPVEHAPFCRYADIPNPAEAYMMLDGWCASRGTEYVPERPVRLQIVGTSIDISTLVLISSLEVKDRGGEPGDIYYSISLREWREIKVRTSAEQRTRNNRPNQKPKPKTILKKAKAGEPTRELLYKIAKRQYGSGSGWTKILSLNKNVLQRDLTKKAVSLVLR